MIDDEKQIVITRGWAWLLLAGAVTTFLIIFGMRFSDSLANKSRLSNAMQSLKSSLNAIAACRLDEKAIFAPNDPVNPKNGPCSDLGNGKYATLGGNSSAGCVYNTSFISTLSGVANGAIQAGCECLGSSIQTCKKVFQCDFATNGQCSETK